MQGCWHSELVFIVSREGSSRGDKSRQTNVCVPVAHGCFSLKLATTGDEGHMQLCNWLLMGLLQSSAAILIAARLS